MSSSDTVDQAVEQLRDRFQEAANDAEEMSERAKQNVTQAIDDLEDRIDQLHDR